MLDVTPFRCYLSLCEKLRNVGMMDEPVSDEWKALRRQAKERLTEHGKIILETRFLGERTKTQQELADQFGISLARVRRLERRVAVAIRSATRKPVCRAREYPLLRSSSEPVV